MDSSMPQHMLAAAYVGENSKQQYVIMHTRPAGTGKNTITTIDRRYSMAISRPTVPGNS